MTTLNARLTRRAFLGGAAAFGAAAMVSPKNAFADPTSADVQAQADEARQKLNSMREQLGAASANYNQAVQEHDEAVSKMDECQTKIDDNNAQIDKLQDKLSKRARNMYRDGQTTFLDVILGSNSFDDFAKNWDTLTSLNEKDSEMVERTKNLRADNEAQKQEYANQADIAQQKVEEADAAQKQAEELVQQYQNEVDSLDSQVAELLAEEEAAAQKAAEEAAAAAAAQAEAANNASSDNGGSNNSASNGGGSSNNASSNGGGSNNNASNNGGGSSYEQQFLFGRRFEQLRRLGRGCCAKPARRALCVGWHGMGFGPRLLRPDVWLLVACRGHLDWPYDMGSDRFRPVDGLGFRGSSGRRVRMRQPCGNCYGWRRIHSCPAAGRSGVLQLAFVVQPLLLRLALVLSGNWKGIDPGRCLFSLRVCMKSKKVLALFGACVNI